MAIRGRSTFQKTQNETARKDRQQRKTVRREHRRMMRSIEERTPPQDLAEGSAEHHWFGRSADWLPVLRRHGSL
jgi:hypothetical protein